MATLSTTRSYEDGEVLVRADLDAFLDDIEAFLNTTKINDDNIQNSGINGATKLLNQSVTEAKIATGAITSLKLADSSVTTAKIADSAVTAAKLDADAVTTVKILDENVTTAKLANEAVTDAKLASSADTDADRAVGTDHIKDENVTTAKIADSAVTTEKINDGAVSPAKQSTYYSLGTIATDASWTLNETKSMGSLSVTGRPVKIQIYDGSFSAGTSMTVVLQYSSDNSSWSTIATVVSLTDDTTHGVTAIFNGINRPRTYPIPATSSDSVADRNGPFMYVHNAPASGTAYYRLNCTAVSGGAQILTTTHYLIEEL